MSMNETEVSNTTEVTDGQSEVEQRLAAIAAAMQNAQTSVDTAVAAKRKLVDGMACPIDPAERALCEGCQ